MKTALSRYWPALIAAAAMLYLVISPSPRGPIDSADGIYANPCCGSLILRRGTLRAGAIEVPYVIQEGKQHPYIVPETYVGVVAGKRIETKPGPTDTMLNYDDTKLKPVVWLPGDDGRIYPFESQTAH